MQWPKKDENPKSYQTFGCKDEDKLFHGEAKKT